MSKRPSQKPQDRDWHVPLAETLKWIENGEKLQALWASRRGAVPEKMAESYAKHLEKMRKQAEKLLKLHKAEEAAKQPKSKKSDQVRR
jgi:hypothetical protein